MKDAQEKLKPRAVKVNGPVTGGVVRRAASFLVMLLLACGVLLAIHLSNRAAPRTVEESKKKATETAAGARSVLAQNYANFSHSYPVAHAALSGRWSCSICHTRTASAIPRFPGHKACISCHQTQFNTPGSPFCTICHTGEALGGEITQQNPGLKNFPSAMTGFSVDFDHAQHMPLVTQEISAQQRCTFCHGPARRGVAETIPAGFNAHQLCYKCHTPGRQSGGNDISTCGACHAPGRYGPTSTNGRSFGLGFSHAEHGPRQNLNCESCHTVARRGLAQGKQVSSTFAAQHFPSTRAQTCVTCHNNRPTFGEANFVDCKRCHEGQTFR